VTVLRPDIADEYVRFVVGDTWRLSGLDFRVADGDKQDGDLVMQWRTPSGWWKVGMPALFLVVDFLYENEHRIYPPRMGFEGGEKLRKRLTIAARDGHERATALLTRERELRLARGDRRDTA
jgi:hypothetical protein